MKYDFTDLTVLIPVRIESIVRLENLLAVLRYLQQYFRLNIIVHEANVADNGIVRSLIPDTVKHCFVTDYDPVYYRTKYINEMCDMVQTEYLSVWDADVIFPVEQIVQSMELLRSGECDFCYPYSGIFMDTSDIIRQMYMENGNLAMLGELQDMMSTPYGDDMRGGAFIAKTQSYREAGMENLQFYGWGPEDWERYERWLALGYTVKDVKGCLFHLSHPRDMNGKNNSSQQRIFSFYQKDITVFSSAEEIKKRMRNKSDA